MSEPKEDPQASPEEGAQQSSAQNNGEAIRRAETLLAVGNDNSHERARQAFVAIEGRGAADRQSTPVTDLDGLSQQPTGDPRDDDEDDVALAANNEVDDSLDEKAREDGVAVANDTSRVVWDLTPHNL
jgi:hypothetical protein